MKRIVTLLGAACLCLTLARPAAAAVHPRVFGPGYATASLAVGSNAYSHAGTGAWYKQFPPGPKFELYVNAATQLGGTFTVDQIASITYHTINGGANPSGVDFYMVLYSTPFVGGDASWYGRKVVCEPYLSNGYVAPGAWVWNTWATTAGPNQLTFFDSNHCGNFGAYGDPTLADLQAGPITWNAWPANSGMGDATPFDYGALTVGQISFQTGSGWASLASYLDDVTIALTTGETYTIDLENTADPLYVDDDWAGAAQGIEVAPGRFFGWNAFDRVQDAVNSAIPGGTVNVAAGSYTEQVVVTGKNLTILGAGAGSTTIVSPATLATSFSTPSVRRPVVLCQGAVDIRIQGVTIDGAGRGNANNGFIGAAWWNAGGKLLNAAITNVQDTPFSGAQHGVALYASANTAGPYTLEVGSCTLSNFQKNGTAFSSTALTVNMHDCVVTGKGATSITAQNGIQTWDLAAATITNCTVSDIYFAGSGWTAAGLLFFGPGSVSVVGGSVTSCQTGAYFQDASGSLAGTSITMPADLGFGAWAVENYCTATSLLAAPSGSPASQSPRVPPAQPLDETPGSAKAGAAGVESGMTVTLSGGCITGPGVAGTLGIEAYSLGGPLDVTATNIELSGWDWGIYAGGTGGASMNANHNSITGNLSVGYEGAATAMNLAERNWWGDAGGPGVGGANPVVGATVDYSPWLTTGTDLAPGCGFTPAAETNTITPGPAPSCITPANACVEIPVGITRNTSENVRAFSVTVQLGGGLSLCGAGITEGTYLSGVGGTQFQVLSNGGGSYTVDCAILGLPCGAIAPTGTLFDMNVSSVSPTGTGTITVTSVTMRDCLNAPVAAVPGPTLNVNIDNTAPAAIANLAAAQVKTGNDADGTTKITLSFTAPVDAAVVKVYRAGFGHYPEYDDAGGAVPATPTYPPGAPWALTSVTASGQTDEVAARDFYYYVAFSIDGCGNVSPVSNKTGGTLNYHLGDVAPLPGNNLVTTLDVSALGAAYGSIDGGLGYLNYLDVGPTTDFSVNARPTTDNKLQFEDLIMFAINYGVVSKPTDGRPVEAAVADAVRLDVPALPAPGQTFVTSVNLSSAGLIQGVSLNLAYDRTMVEPVVVEAGELMGRQSGEGLVLSSAPGNVDAAVLGTGATISGSGELARVTFRVLATGDAHIALGSADARDTQNRKVSLNVTGGVTGGLKPVLATFLGANYPNPFHGSTSIPVGLAKGGLTKLAVFDVAGRLVRTLMDGPMEAGARVVEWDGRDNGGQSVASGFYVIRLTAPDDVRTRSVKIVR